MSYGIDVNLLLYASDESCEQHEAAAAFLQRCAAGPEVFCLAWLTVMSYLRMATHPAIFGKPLSPAEAGRNIQALLDLPHCRMVSEEEGFWEAYQAITRDVPVRGNLVPDAHLSAVLSQHGVSTLYTHDKDFRRFAFLDVRDPLN